MKASSRHLAGLTLASFVFAAPVAAQEFGSMQVGRTTVSVGAGTALLTLPDVPSVMTRTTGALPASILQTFKSSDDFGDEKWRLNPGVMGVTRAPHRRTFALGADIRGIDQDFNETFSSPTTPAFSAVYNEDLDTRYYRAYAAWGGGYSLPFLSGLTGGMGLQSTFLLRGGVYYADTDYTGRLTTAGGVQSANSALSLSDNDIAFIGGIVLETRKRIGRRATLSLKSEYEYYSYVPEMAYNQREVRPGFVSFPGGQVGTRIGSDDAFSARTSLRLTIKLGPDSVFEDPMK